MIELRILGSPRITTPDLRRAEALIHRPKRTALLAYLAFATPRGPHQRDKLLALFWPESDAAHARSALSQALYVIRTALGENAILSVGDDQVALDPGVVWCDAVAFEQHLDAGRPADALALYSADLLDGFFVAGAPEFEQWLDRERERLRQRVSEGAWELARAAAAKGNTVEAARWARRASDVVPADEAVARRLMQFLHDLGDRAAAVRAYEAFAHRLAHEFELEPAAETRRLAARIRNDAGDATAPREVAPSLPLVTAHTAAPIRKTRTASYVAIAGAAIVLAAIAWRSLQSPVAAGQPRMDFPLEFGSAPPLASEVPASTIALSPNADRLVYVGGAAQNTELFVRRMDRLETSPVQHSRGARLPFFSPDGESLGFAIGDTLREVRLAGGPAITLGSATGPIMGASWGTNGVIIFATRAGVWRVPDRDGTPTMVVPAAASGPSYRWPHVLPGGSAAILTRLDTTGFNLVAVRLTDGAVTSLGVKGTDSHFVPPGTLVYATMDGALFAAPFDAERLRVTGAPHRIAERVFVGTGGAGKFGVSRTGALAYVPEQANRTLVLVDRSGRAELVPVAPQAFAEVRFSPDGRHLAVTARALDTQQLDIWLLDLLEHSWRRLTGDRGSASPVWAPDAREIVFGSGPGGRDPGFALRSAPVGGGQPPRALLPHEVGQLPMAITPDGRSLLFQRLDAETGRDVWILPLNGDRGATPYLDGPADERAPAFSPDGHWVAYGSDESGRQEVYVAEFPNAATRRRISSGGGWEPRWAARSGELFYRTSEGMMAVTVRTAPRLQVGAPHLLFDDKSYLSWFNAAAYDVRPDGQGFAMIRRGSDSRQIVLVLNWANQRRGGDD